MESITTADSNTGTAEKAYLADRFRRFGAAISKISDFDAFRGALAQAVEQDGFFRSRLLTKPTQESLEAADQVFGMDEVVLPLDAASGILKIESRHDAKPFGAEDLQLMGALAEFVTSLCAESQKLKRDGQTSRILQYLVNQLPLGVVCFDAEGGVIVKSKLAERLMGEAELEQLSSLLANPEAFARGKTKLHFEVEGRLVYCEGRQLQIDDGLSVAAFVLYDFSKLKKQLAMDLDREAFRVESRGGKLTVAVLEMRAGAGTLYHRLRESAKQLGLTFNQIQPLDAHNCVCLFPDFSPATARARLRGLPEIREADLKLSLLSYSASDASAASPAAMMIEKGRSSLQPAALALLPQALVLDSYAAVTDSLEMAAGDLMRFQKVDTVDALFDKLEGRECDALFVSLECIPSEKLQKLCACVLENESPVKLYCTSYRQVSMLRSGVIIDETVKVFQKPFSISEVRERIEKDFRAH